jgi:hypothetical protein
MGALAGNITAHMSGRGGIKNGKISQSIFSPFQAILSTLFFSKKKTKKNDPLGAAPPPNLIFFLPQILFFCDLKPNAKFQNLKITPSGRKVTLAERRRKKEKRR